MRLKTDTLSIGERRIPTEAEAEFHCNKPMAHRERQPGSAGDSAVSIEATAQNQNYTRKLCLDHQTTLAPNLWEGFSFFIGSYFGSDSGSDIFGVLGRVGENSPSMRQSQACPNTPKSPSAWPLFLVFGKPFSFPNTIPFSKGLTSYSEQSGY